MLMNGFYHTQITPPYICTRSHLVQLFLDTKKLAMSRALILSFLYHFYSSWLNVPATPALPLLQHPSPRGPQHALK
jgi:hypothetical protein